MSTRRARVWGGEARDLEATREAASRITRAGRGTRNGGAMNSIVD